MIIGLTGTKASGKGMVADYLKSKGFEYKSTSEVVKAQAEARGITNYNVPILQNLGNKLRLLHGPASLVRRCLEDYDFSRDLIIDGVRNPEEVKVIQEYGIVIGVDAPVEERYKRLIARNRPTDPKNLEEFTLVDRVDRGDGLSDAGQQVDKCISEANYKIDNNSDLDLLKIEVDKILQNREQHEIYRPSWDEMFMFMALGASERGSCKKIKTGAVVVKDKRVIATGYNGAPRGIKNCLERGCRKEEMGITFEEKGSGHCRGEHAERNAFLQVSCFDSKGGTLYTILHPCEDCAKQIQGAGIREVVYLQNYKEPSKLAQEIFKEGDIYLRKMNPIFFEKYVKYGKLLMANNQTAHESGAKK